MVNRIGTANLREMIEAQYATYGPRPIAANSGYSVGYVRCMASAMGIPAPFLGGSDYPRWTIFQVRRLRQEYGRTPVAILARDFGRTEQAIHRKASAIGIGRVRGKTWDAADDAFLRANYPRLTIAECALALDRTFHSVKHRVSALRLRKRAGRRNADNHPWRKEAVA